MKKYEAMLRVVRECDYRVLEGPASCGCQPPETRCLLGRGGWARDRHVVNPNDCLKCTKGGEDGRVVDADSEAGEAGDGVSDDHNEPPGSHRRHGTAIGGTLVPVSAESGIEREILRLEREFQEIWFDIRNIQNFRNPATEQGQAALFNALKGGGFPTGFHPGDFGCPGGMPPTLNWSDPVFGNGTLTFNSSTNCYSSGQVLVTVPAACDGSCPGASNVPMQVDYCPDGVTTSFKCDGSGCPTSGSLGDSMGCNFGWPAPTILVCDTVTPANTTSNPTSPNDVSNGSPANKMGYCPPNDVASFGPTKAGESGCPAQPRTIYVKSATYGLFTLIYNDSSHQWESLHKNITVAANVNGSGCPSKTVSVQMFRNILSLGGTPRLSFPSAIGGCPDPSNAGGAGSDNWQSYNRDSCNPYRAHGDANTRTGFVIPQADTYTIN